MNSADIFARGMRRAQGEIDMEDETQVETAMFLTGLAEKIRKLESPIPLTVAEYNNHMIVSLPNSHENFNFFTVRWHNGWMIDQGENLLSVQDQERLFTTLPDGRGEGFDAADIIIEALGYWVKTSSNSD
ncbi:hypothetical protein [Paracoccus alcaliphilus]|uniref:hypothetical protein n=1 Tax=Paracoccus alcaliphilus TaxID=34002 RepID=UPI001113BDD5|nr:hypothetical protein [Paracoccus alcaliphilus]WCR17500.1 hypothetical protein JHW40_14350 [Paracoccus alcaliphilus]